MKIKITWLAISVAFLMSFLSTTSLQAQKKREFRGAWIQCVNGQFMGMGTEQMQKTLSYQLDELQKDGCNAIIFQVRAECDALYQSSIEPWSYYLTGQQGVAPQPFWDPLAWMVAECHRRGMELHAWINPYRAKTKAPHLSAGNHITNRYPEWCFMYDGLTLLNPALKESRDYICGVVRDIVERYDVDGLHIDDYFYPYPVSGVTIPDYAWYELRQDRSLSLGDWRRDNVNQFIKQLGETIHETKPWVKFGVSPFGIYRNKRNDPDGSHTSGLQNYDDLYADVLLWADKGWIDYCVPQLYWEIGHRAADYDELIHWWNDHCKRVPLYIGEDIERTAKYSDPKNPNIHQMSAKMALHEQMPNVKGTVLWYAKAAVDNVGGYGTSLRNVYWRFPALQPTASKLDNKKPRKVRRLKLMEVEGKRVLFWQEPKAKGWGDIAAQYVVYRFSRDERIDTDDPSKIVAVTKNTFYELPESYEGSRYVYLVTALDRIQNESRAKKIKVKY